VDDGDDDDDEDDEDDDDDDVDVARRLFSTSRRRLFLLLFFGSTSCDDDDDDDAAADATGTLFCTLNNLDTRNNSKLGMLVVFFLRIFFFFFFFLKFRKYFWREFVFFEFFQKQKTKNVMMQMQSNNMTPVAGIQEAPASALLQIMTDPKAIDEEIALGQQAILSWVTEQMKSYNREKRDYVLSMAEHQNITKQLNAAKAEFLKQEACLRSELEAHGKLLEEQQLELAKLGDARESMPPQLKQAQGAMEREKAALDDEQRVFANSKRQARFAKMELERGVDYFRRRLGVDVRSKSGGQFQIVFTQVDPSNPQRQFSFTMRLNGDLYELMACEPRISQLRPLIDQLNASNDLKAFVIDIRKHFRSIV
jgi:kinetochore protein Spc25, animal type